jgi:hypothetical protein
MKEKSFSKEKFKKKKKKKERERGTLKRDGAPLMAIRLFLSRRTAEPVSSMTHS